MLKKLIYIFLFLCCTNRSYAQEMLGISNSNFAGNMGMGLNPSLFVGSPYLSEWNIISGDFFVDNDYVYIQPHSSVLFKSVKGESIPEEDFKDYYNSKPKNAYANIFLRGPSYIKNNEKYSWGFHTAFRSNMSATDVPFHLAKFIKEGFDYEPQHDIRYVSTPFKSATMSWGELGGTLGKRLYERRDKGLLTGAVTLKFITGFDAAYADITSFDYIVPSPDTLIVNNATGEYAHALSPEGNALSKPLKIRGYGAGIDIGITYYRGRVHGGEDCNETAENLKKYKYRLGFSIIDIGMVKFVNEAGVFSFNNASTVWPGIDTVKFDSVYGVDTSISYHFYGDPVKSRSADKFSIFLPSAISAQFDYCIMPRIYANATIIQSIPLSKISIVRASQISVSARYETRKFEVTLPFTLYGYKDPHLGLAFRYKFFVLGTDRLGSFTGLWDTTGYDLFFGFKWNVCELKKRGGKQPFCPTN